MTQFPSTYTHCPFVTYTECTPNWSMQLKDRSHRTKRCVKDIKLLWVKVHIFIGYTHFYASWPLKCFCRNKKRNTIQLVAPILSYLLITRSLKWIIFFIIIQQWFELQTSYFPHTFMYMFTSLIKCNFTHICSEYLTFSVKSKGVLW